MIGSVDMESKLDVMATHVCAATDDLYQLVDFLNRNLKDRDIVFGLSRMQDESGKMLITLYRT